MHRPSELVDQTGRPLDTIAMIAYPGGGKGTTEMHIKSRFDAHGKPFEYFEIGGMIRQHFAKNTPQATIIKENTPPGGLVADSVIVPIIQDGLKGINGKIAWVLDGYPRNRHQATTYVEDMEMLERQDAILYLQLHEDYRIAEEIADERMAKRGEKAQAIGAKVRPEDIDADLRRERLIAARELYEVIDDLRASGKKIFNINGSKSIDDVRAQVDAAVLNEMLSMNADANGYAGGNGHEGKQLVEQGHSHVIQN